MTQPLAITDEQAPRPNRRRHTRASQQHGLDIAIARTPEEVAEAWNLVYRSYRDAELIDENPHAIHSVPHALTNGTTVIVGRVDAEVVSTLTIMHDHVHHGLPLDRVYRHRLDLLRAKGRRLMEVGLFADRRLSISRAISAFAEMMRFVFYNSCYNLADIMIGVHPSHAAFYQRNYGFVIEGPVDVHPVVNHHPVVLLRGDPQAQLKSQPLLPNLAQYVDRPLARAEFAKRATLHRDTLNGTPLAGFAKRMDELWSNLSLVPKRGEARIA